MADQLAKQFENSEMPDIYEEQRRVFSLAGKILSEQPDQINVVPIVSEQKLHKVMMETVLTGKDGSQIKMQIGVSDLQSNPEIRLIIQSKVGHYEVRVSAKPTDLDEIMIIKFATMGFGDQKRVFNDVLGGNNMNAKMAADLLEGVTTVQRPLYNIMTDMTLTQFAAVSAHLLPKGIPSKF